MIDRLRRALRYAWLAWKDEPVKSWRKLDNGQYFCDGDCRRWTPHGVCTCGLTHYFKIIPNGHDRIKRDKASWVREYQSEEHMLGVPPRTHCSHGHPVYSDERCQTCMEEVTLLIEELNKPVGRCPKCDTPWYTNIGFCGGCYKHK